MLQHTRGLLDNIRAFVPPETELLQAARSEKHEMLLIRLLGRVWLTTCNANHNHASPNAGADMHGVGPLVLFLVYDASLPNVWHFHPTQSQRNVLTTTLYFSFQASRYATETCQFHQGTMTGYDFPSPTRLIEDLQSRRHAIATPIIPHLHLQQASQEACYSKARPPSQDNRVRPMRYHDPRGPRGVLYMHEHEYHQDSLLSQRQLRKATWHLHEHAMTDPQPRSK
jgi:hypothetical protein